MCLGKCCYVATCEIVDQQVFHKSAERVATVNSMPNSSWNSLFQYWLFGGMFGAHRFKSRHIRMGQLYLFLWLVALSVGLTPGQYVDVYGKIDLPFIQKFGDSLYLLFFVLVLLFYFAMSNV